MNENAENRLTRRFARHAQVEIRGHSRSGWRVQGELIDCSEGGVGFFSPEPVKKGEVVLLRVCQESPHDTSRWPQEAGQFNMITAKVRWCIEGRTVESTGGFRVGVQRMLPFY